MDSRIGPLDPGYTEIQDAYREATIEETLNFDTYLVELRDRRYEFGCWFEDYTDERVKQKVLSMSLIELFAHGFRLRDCIRVREWEAKHFVHRFSRGLEEASPELTVGFTQHMQEHIGGVSAETLAKFAGVRAWIFDVSVRSLARKFR